jgi:galactose mutarotase-like enzyme
VTATVEDVDLKSWAAVRLRSDVVEVDILPEKGADILAVRWLPLDINVLWTTPWGLRRRGQVPTSAGSITAFMESYFGGWQTIFPNGGPSVVEAGADWSFHGEACLAPWNEVERTIDADRVSVTFETALVRSPFQLTKQIELAGDELRVTETVLNDSPFPREVMWSHHPAFGPPLLDAGARLEADASWFAVDPDRDVPFGDLEPGSRHDWPTGANREGAVIDLGQLPGPSQRLDRMGYLGGFGRGRCAVVNQALPLRAELSWDESVFPYAWVWQEAHATEAFPWFGRVYVLGLEPATSYPGTGLASVRETTGTQVCIEGGETRTVWLALRLRDDVT